MTTLSPHFEQLRRDLDALEEAAADREGELLDNVKENQQVQRALSDFHHVVIQMLGFPPDAHGRWEWDEMFDLPLQRLRERLGSDVEYDEFWERDHPTPPA